MKSLGLSSEFGLSTPKAQVSLAPSLPSSSSSIIDKLLFSRCIMAFIAAAQALFHSNLSRICAFPQHSSSGHALQQPLSLWFSWAATMHCM